MQICGNVFWPLGRVQTYLEPMVLRTLLRKTALSTLWLAAACAFDAGVVSIPGPSEVFLRCCDQNDFVSGRHLLSLHFQLTAPHLHPCGVIRGLWVYHAFAGFGAPDNCKYSPNSPRDSIIMSSHVQPMIMSARAQAQVCVLRRKHLVSVSVKSLLLNLPLKHVWTDFEQWLNHCFHVFNVSTSFNYQLTSTNIN